MAGNVRRLHWDRIAPGASLHAALFAVERAAGFQITLHDHDFYEMLYILSGSGVHEVNGAQLTLAAGDLTLLRAADRHAVSTRPGERLYWINVAFPRDAWADFRQAGGLQEPYWEAGMGVELPPSVSVPAAERALCNAAFELALLDYRRAQEGTGAPLPGRLELCRFLAAATPFLRSGAAKPFPGAAASVELAPGTPAWLADACHSLARDPAASAEGLPRLRALSGVSEAHLARALKAATGQTPTAFVNHLRLSRAALLLTTTALPVAQVSAECGFGQLSYFYRLFTRRFQMPPHLYRQRAWHPVTPAG